MLGAIIGDIVGSRFERHNHKSKDFDLFTDRCRFTDDTAMTVAVAKALLECKGDYTELSDHTVRCMQEIGRKYPNAGYGQIFYLWLHHKNPGPYRSYGNGSAMRVSPGGLCCQNGKRMYPTCQGSNAGQSRSSRGDKRRGGCGFGYLGCDAWNSKRSNPGAHRGVVLYFGFHY